MAKALFNSSAQSKGLALTADSAGTIPSDHVHPEVVAAMQELGHDLSLECGKLLTDEMLNHRPLVVTMGCSPDARACPALRLTDIVDWALPDPKGLSLNFVKEIRDEIMHRVDQLLVELSQDMDELATGSSEPPANTA